ncbi:MAG: hypothetical protein WCO83_08750, partial [Alphaproteobacteria bacterium]
MTWIPAFAGMTGGWEVRIALAPNTGHPGGGLGPVRRVVTWIGALGGIFPDRARPMTWIPAFAGMTGGWEVR